MISYAECLIRGRSNFYKQLLILISALMLLVPALAHAQTDTLKTMQQITDAEALLSWYANESVDLDSIGEAEDRARAYHLLGRAYYRIGNSPSAQKAFAEAVSLLEEPPKDFELGAAIYNDMGLALIERASFDDAHRYFSQASAWAGQVDAHGLAVISGINLAKTLLRKQEGETVPALLATIKNHLEKAPPGLDTVRHWLSVGQLYREAMQNGRIGSDGRLQALQAYRKAQEQAQAFEDQGTLAYIDGYLGELYEDEGRFADALVYTRKAVFNAQVVGDDTSLYKWQWQMGRVLKKQGETEASEAQYRQAIETLNRTRTSLTLGPGVNYKQSVGPVYYEFADLLLKQANNDRNEEQIQANLNEVIAVLEAAKQAEVEDYFDSECVQLPDQQIKLAQVLNDAAIIYPVLLRDRTELLVQFPERIEQFTVDVSAKRLRETVNEYRALIETFDQQNGFMAPAQELYDWLIKPLKAALVQADVKTLVFVPDGPLRSIPISALHNGKQFLIEEFAIATTPGITLTDPEPFMRENIRVLAGGLSKGVQGYSPLPSVQQELQNVSQVFNTTLYQDNSYQLQKVADEMSTGNYNIVHFATHGEFNSDHTKSFLLTYDNKLTMNQLENTIGLRRFQSEPIELLVLSACQTAVGDERAALGLAGVALQAGARSALATLWFINDQATSLLIADFYQQLSRQKQTKAEALQTAQVNMITQTRYKHPSFWAPFLMIGNWM